MKTISKKSKLIISCSIDYAGTQMSIVLFFHYLIVVVIISIDIIILLRKHSNCLLLLGCKMHQIFDILTCLISIVSFINLDSSF